MKKRLIKLKLMNGLNFETFRKEVLDLYELSENFSFIESEDKPNVIIFGPYGNNIPPKGDYIRVGYFCENMNPELTCCEWAFGIPREEEINHPNYQRIQWHGLHPNQLLKSLSDNDIDEIYSGKTKFCNFLYSHQVPYREEFFRQLSKYKKVDAPGKSMNNMPSIDHFYQGDIWERKRQFLITYKFTIAFENYVYPGYQTEKLYDAMLCNSIPIYCGDPNINEIFNTKSFINTPDFIKIRQSSIIRYLQKKSQLTFIDILPQFHYGPKHRLQRKLKDWGKKVKMKLEFNNLDFSLLVDRIIELDKNPDLYKKMLKENWLTEQNTSHLVNQKAQWIAIFNSL